jgi:hypothetical protein
MPDCLAHQVAAYILAIDYEIGFIDLMCVGLDATIVQSATRYRLTCGNGNTGTLLAEGNLSHFAGESGVLRIALPHSVVQIDERLQLRKSNLLGVTINFSSPDPHLNDVCCEVTDISFDGVTVGWTGDLGSWHIQPGFVTDRAMLHCGQEYQHLGHIAVSHVMDADNGFVVGYTLCVANEPTLERLDEQQRQLNAAHMPL